MLAAASLAAVLLQPPAVHEPGVVSTIETDEVHYAIRVPKERDRRRGSPAIVFIHGSNMRGEAYARSLETARSLDDVVLIGPTGPHRNGDDAFNHDPGDERYIARILRDVEQRLEVKLSRVYVGGHSQGAFLSHAVAAHLPERIDGVLAVSGGSWVPPRRLLEKGAGRAGQEIPVAIVHAQDDPVVDFRASVGVHDAYVAAGHRDVRLFAPTEGAHMFMRLPILQALAWLDLMNSNDRQAVAEALSKTEMAEDPRTLWDAAQRAKRLAKGRHKKADAVLKRIARHARKRAADLGARLSRARERDAQLIAEAWTFLADYGMVEAEGAWRKPLTKLLRRE